jgi:heme oxygenase
MIMTRLRDETRVYHARLEAMPYFRALIAHQLPLDSYVNQLRALSIIHGVMESQLACSDETHVKAVWDERLRKFPLLESDLGFFAPRVILDATDPVNSALAMAAKIGLRQVEQPVSLLGYLYVMEGSTLGNQMHQPDITETFQLDDGDGVRYYASYRDAVHSQWRAFASVMDRVLVAADVQDLVLQGAHEAFCGLEELYRILYPLDGKHRCLHATRINPEAGNHPIPQDEREIQAALRASGRSWLEFPYYGLRYGERGRRFSESDTCWLATLITLDEEKALKQVQWMCRLLGARGMPALMMEQTLLFLAEELTRAVPDKAVLYQRLRATALVLRAARHRIIPEALFRQLSDEFDSAVGDELARRHRNTGKLLVAAVVDEVRGVPGALQALEGFLGDSTRFPPRWVRAVAATIRQAMGHVGLARDSSSGAVVMGRPGHDR